jgi:proteasome lid subunit RPN8/RPN11
MILEIKRTFLDRIKEEAKINQVEICGFIIGEIRGSRAIATEIKSAKNVLNSPTRFQIDPEDFLKTLAKAESRKLEIIGFYHSHPAPPYPSLVDEKFMALWPDKIWLIVSTISTFEPSTRAFIKRAEKFEEIKIIEK